jgi:hypothetical protein
MTVIKGKALRQDFKHYDGINPNGSRKDSTGGFFQGLAVGDEVDLLMVYGSGNERNNQTIQNAVTAIGSRKATLKFAPGTWTISSNVTVPGNLTASIPAGVTFDIASGITLTFSGPVRADSENIKTGSGTLTYTDERMLQSVAGTNTITASSLSTTTALRNGQEFFIIPANTITAAATLNINSTGAVNLRKNQSGGVVALVANDLIANNLYRCTYVSAGPYFIVHALSSYAQGAAIASATTINLDTATGDYVHVTGTAIITGVTLKQGQRREIVFDGEQTLTDGASFILPGGDNIKTSAGDSAILRGEASGVVRCLAYIPSKPVTGYVSAQRTYIHVDGADATGFAVVTAITENTFEAVGPTGSGATNIWTAMDLIPVGATAAILKTESSFTTNATTGGGLTFYGCQGGSAATATTATKLFQFEYEAVASGDVVVASHSWLVVPLDSSRVMNLTWGCTADSARSITASLQGFMV